MARLNGDPMYPSYRDGKCLIKPVEDLLKASGIDMSNGQNSLWAIFSKMKERKTYNKKLKNDGSGLGLKSKR